MFRIRRRRRFRSRFHMRHRGFRHRRRGHHRRMAGFIGYRM